MADLRIASCRENVGIFKWYYDREYVRFTQMQHRTIGIVAKIRIHDDDAVMGVHLDLFEEGRWEIINKHCINAAINVIRHHGYVDGSAEMCGDIRSWYYGVWQKVQGVYDDNYIGPKFDYLDTIKRGLNIRRELIGACGVVDIYWSEGNWCARLAGGNIQLGKA
jgi:hypothetical protein